MSKNKKIIIGILIVLIVCIVIAYKIIENINFSPVNTIDHGQNEIK